MTAANSFDQVMDRLSPRVYTLARYSLANASDAEDVTQDVFTRLWENWNSLDPDRVEGWLIRATTNACIDHQRRRGARRQREVSHESTTHAPDPAAALETRELQTQVNNAISRLDEPFRSILVLREIEGLSYQQISDALNLNLTQVKVYLHRGRARLTTALAPLRDASAPALVHQEGAIHVP